MANLNGLAKDLAIEVEDQGKKLVKLEENMEAADDNAAAAVKELKSAKKHQKTSSCCLRFLVIIIILALGISGVLIYFLWIKKDDKKKLL